jgi:hypothetical protein
MAVVTIDSTDMDAVIADETRDMNAPRAKAEAKPEAKVETPADDEEDENGLTAAQRAELSAKMLKAIGKKHRQLKEAEEFAAAQYNAQRLAEQRAADLERQLQELKAKEAPKTAEKPPEKPKRADYQDDIAYVEALTDYQVNERLKKIDAERQAAEAERQQKEILEAASARIAKARELMPDFSEVVESVDQVVPPAVAGYMQQSEMFAELGYYLAKHPEEIGRLQKMQPAMQLVTIGKIEAKLSPFSAIAAEADGAKPKAEPDAKPSKAAASDETVTPPSKARASAPVITPLTSSGAAQVDKDEAEMNPRELIQTWAKQNKVDFSRRKRH